MAVETDIEAPITVLKRGSHWLTALWHRLTVRFVLLLSLVMFFVAVSIDSFQHQAAAADMPLPTSTMAEMSVSLQDTTGPSTLASFNEDTYLDFDAETARRLRHSTLTQARLTSNRLTQAHFFTRQVR